MKILFIGCVESSYRLLEALIKNDVNVSGVVTKERSDFNGDFCDLRPLCEAYNIPYYYTRNINDRDSMDFIKASCADIGFCFGWSQLVKEEVIRLFPKGIIGFHPAALPDNRGRHPIIWALALGLSQTASTFFMLNAGADEGDIVSQRPIAIDYEDDAGTLYTKIMNCAVKQELELVYSLEHDILQRVHQSPLTGNSWRKRDKSDGEIDWRMPSRGIYNLVRSLTKPYAGAHLVFNGREYKVWKVRETAVLGMENMEPGKVLSVNDDGTINVKAGEGSVKLVEFDKISVQAGDYIL